MQLSDLLEENTIKTISDKTKISEENLEYLLENDFGAIRKVKTLGFISILEREYHIDLSKLREDVLTYYAQHNAVESVTIVLPIMEKKKGKTKWLLWLIAPLLWGYVSWYFLKSYDQSQLKALLPFNEAKSVETITPKETTINSEELSIKNVLAADENENEINSSENN